MVASYSKVLSNRPIPSKATEGVPNDLTDSKFVNKLMKNSGIEYTSIKDLFDLPTIH